MSISMCTDLKDINGNRVWNIYHCTVCTKAGIEHVVTNEDAGRSGPHCQWGKDIPMTKQVCSNCGAMTGPWIDTKYTGEGW